MSESFCKSVIFTHFDTPYIHVEFAEYEIQNYSDDLFCQFNIRFPNKLKGSVPKRKAEYLAGRFVAKKALSKFSIENWHIPSDRNNCPLWPENFIGSITHSKGLVACALSKKTSKNTVLGIDYEPLLSKSSQSAIQAQVLSNRERDLICKSQWNANTISNLIFSAKESFFKAYYPQVGAYFNFSAIELNNFDVSNKKAFFKINRLYAPKHLFHLEAIEIKFDWIRNGVFTIVSC